MRSCTLFAGTPGWTTRRRGADVASVIGAKSLTGSYGTFFWRKGSIQNELPLKRSV
jgi:hypothetical protein